MPPVTLLYHYHFPNMPLLIWWCINQQWLCICTGWSKRNVIYPVFSKWMYANFIRYANILFFQKKKKKQEFVDYLILDLVTYLEYLTVSCDDKLLRSYICMLASFLSLFWQIYKLKCYISTQYKTGFCPSYLSQLYLDPGLIYILVPGPMAKEHGEPLVPIGTTIQD